MEKKHNKITREFIIPTDWSEVTLPQYMKFLNATKPYEGTPDWPRIAVEKAALYLCGIDSQSLKMLPMREWTEITQSITQLLQRAKHQPLVATIRLDGIEYGFFPDLDGIEYGAYLDVQNWSKNTWGNIQWICAALYRPIRERVGNRYSVTEYNGVTQEVADLWYSSLTMDVVWGCVGFFLNGVNELLEIILHSSKEEMKRMGMNTHLVQVLERSGQHTKHLSSLQERIHWKSTEQLD